MRQEFFYKKNALKFVKSQKLIIPKSALKVK